jgi:hypothetical protein
MENILDGEEVTTARDVVICEEDTQALMGL